MKIKSVNDSPIINYLSNINIPNANNNLAEVQYSKERFSARYIGSYLDDKIKEAIHNHNLGVSYNLIGNRIYKMKLFSKRPFQVIENSQTNKVLELIPYDKFLAKKFLFTRIKIEKSLNQKKSLKTAILYVEPDILIDDKLIEIKTYNSDKINIKDWTQIIYYYVLITIKFRMESNFSFLTYQGKNIPPIKNFHCKNPIKYLCFYFARHGKLIKISTSKLFNNNEDTFIKIVQNELENNNMRVKEEIHFALKSIKKL